MRLVKKEPDKAYLSDMLWLPKSHISEKAIKEALQYWDVEKGNAVLRRLWDETRDHLIVPREFLKPEQYPRFPFPFIDLTPKKFHKTNLWVKNEPRNDQQKAALAAFPQTHGGILNLGCGKGKTFLSLKRVAEIGCPILVVVHNTFLMKQWMTEAIPFHVELPIGEKVGVIQGDQFDWKRPITVAMIHTLAARADEGRLPPDFYSWFGAVIFDEVHHLSAPLFATTAPLIKGMRFGLTATDKRTDGTDFIYKFHIGDIFYTDLTQDLIPRIYFQYTPVTVDLKREEVLDVKGDVNIGRLRSFIGDLPLSNNFRAFCIREALNEGRKILCVSHSKNQLRNLSEMFPGSGLIIQETPAEERTRIVRSSQVTFAIASLGFEGLDDDNLDTVFALLPFGSKDAPPNDLQQVMGRIQREKEGKHHPVLVIFDDIGVKPFHAMCNTMRKALKEWDKHVPGMPALSFQTLHAPKLS